MTDKKQKVSKQDRKTYGPYGPGELRYDGRAAGMVAVEREFLEVCGFVQKPDGAWTVPAELKDRVNKAIAGGYAKIRIKKL